MPGPQCKVINYLLKIGFHDARKEIKLRAYILRGAVYNFEVEDKFYKMCMCRYVFLINKFLFT